MVGAEAEKEEDEQNMYQHLVQKKPPKKNKNQKIQEVKPLTKPPETAAVPQMASLSGIPPMAGIPPMINPMHMMPFMFPGGMGFYHPQHGMMIMPPPAALPNATPNR